uniref:Endoplasmic reticulum metallopeptidase 1 n=3 Tax=Kalanchoe fedtschenkoi TaxID=63787 RepID=A0A7N0VGJ7_KALFE
MLLDMQDVFPVIPGDTDYRIFAEDDSDIPGLDIIFLLGGYFYHTSFDTLERLLPGSIQARGENLFSLLKAFSSSSNLRNAQQRASAKASAGTFDDQRAVFFDYLSLFMILYSKKAAMVLHCIPVIIFVVMPFVLRLPSMGFNSALATLQDFVKGVLLHAIGIILAVVVPIMFSILRLLFSSQAMNWFRYPCLAFMMFIPSSLIGILIPRFFWKSFPTSQDIIALKTSQEELCEEARFWGGFGYYALFTMAYILAGLSGGFLTFTMAASMLLAWFCFRVSARVSGLLSVRSAMYYLIPLIPCLIYSAYFGGFLVQFLIEKMGMMGSLPPPYGFFVPDIIVAAVIGIVTGICMGPLVPICGHWLARTSILTFLLHITVLALALSSQFFPYSSEAPKRVVFQHTLVTSGVGKIMESTYDFSVVDSNSLHFVFKNSREVAKKLDLVPDLYLDTVKLSEQKNWLALFPVNFLFSNSLKFPSSSEDIVKDYQHLPSLSTFKLQALSNDGSRRVHLELDLGSLKEVWVTVLNITGPLSSWSFAENILPAPETMNNGPPSYILRLSGSGSENWRFWLEANSSETLRVEVAVLDQHLVDDAEKLKSLFPSWVDVIAYSSFISTYTF